MMLIEGMDGGPVFPGLAHEEVSLVFNSVSRIDNDEYHIVTLSAPYRLESGLRCSTSVSGKNSNGQSTATDLWRYRLRRMVEAWH